MGRIAHSYRGAGAMSAEMADLMVAVVWLGVCVGVLVLVAAWVWSER